MVRPALLLFAVAVAVRAVAALQTAAIFNDGPLFLRLAGLAASGDTAGLLSHAYHPLYPVLVAAVHVVVPDWVGAGVTVSVLTGAAAVPALYAFLRWAFDDGVAWVGALLLAVSPYAVVFSADVQSEGLYLGLFAAQLALLWRALEDGQPVSAAAAGVAGGLAYLTRPEGLGLLAIGGLFAAVDTVRGRWRAGAAARWLLALGLGSLLVAGPYLVHLRVETGRWVLTQKKSMADLSTPAGAPVRPGEGTPDIPAFELPQAPLLGLAPRALPPPVAAGGQLLSRGASALHYGTFALALIGAFALGGRPGRRGAFVLAVLLLYGAVLFALALNAGYLSRRHTLPPLLPLFGYAAVGVRWLAGRLANVSPASPRAALAALLAVLVLASLAKAWSPRRDRQLAERRAAEWLAEREDLRGPVAAEKLRTAFYAGEAFVLLDRIGGAGDPAALRRTGARFLVIDAARLDAYPGLAGPGLRELHRAGVGGREGVVYELVAPSPAL